MLERVILSVLLLLGLVAFLTWLKGWQLRRANRTQGQPLAGQAVVYFWSAQCARCRHVQAPILQRLKGVTLISHSVSESPDLAREWGVTTVPTTFVIDSNGMARHVNNGLASEALLRRQLGMSEIAAKAPTDQA